MADEVAVPPIVLHIPHASTDIPLDVRESFVIDDSQLELELLQMTDHFTDELFLVPPDVATSVAGDATTTRSARTARWATDRRHQKRSCPGQAPLSLRLEPGPSSD